jgi:DNA-damage-inducible protein J
MPISKKTVTRAKTSLMPKVASKPKNMKTATINVRIDPVTKAKAEKIFDQLGISISQGISMYLKSVIYNKGIPFEARVPNKETREAMMELRTNKKLKTYTSTEAMFKDLLS